MGNLFKLFKRELFLDPPKKKLLPSEEVADILSLEKLTEETNKELEALKERSLAECEQIKQQAHKEGFEKGLQELNEKILEFDNHKKQLAHELNQMVLALALKAAKRIVNEELKTHPEAIVSIVRQALLPALQSKKVIIWLSPEDRKQLDRQEEQKNSLKEKLEQIQTFLIKEKEDLKPGDCLIETDTGIINATLESQWRTLEAALEKHVKEGG